MISTLNMPTMWSSNIDIATVMIQKLVWAIFFYAFLITFTETEGGLITDYRKCREYNIRSNVPDETSVQWLQKSKTSSTSCSTKRSVATITRVGDQTFDPNRITTLLGPFTPRTRTQRPSTTTSTKIPTKKWKCNEGIEDELASDLSNTIATVWQDITLPTVMPKYPTPIDPVTKLFLKMTSVSRWRKRPTEKKCIKSCITQ